MHASRGGAARAPRCTTWRALGSRQDARPGAPFGLVAGPAGGVGGVCAHLPDVSARQGRPPAAGLPAVPPACPHAPRRVYEPGLPQATRRPIRPRLFAGAHRPLDRARGAGPDQADLQDRSAETAARNFVASVFRAVRLPAMLVLDRDTRSTSAF